MREFSGWADCVTRPCQLPAPHFKLEGVKVAVFGAAAGLDSRRAAALIKSWEGYFTRSGVKQANLQR